jgi:modulator of FtsH protease
VFAHNPTEWHDLFVATAGAGAALAGLVFVAVSINIERILEYEGLPDRALQTVVLLLNVVVISIIGLIPGQGHGALGIELLLFGSATAWIMWRLAFRQPSDENEEPRVWKLNVLSWGTLPTLVGAITIIAADGGVLYWIVFGIVGAIVGAVANAWVLLVEILR